MPLDITTFAPALKQYYKRDFVENLVYKNNPFLALVTKDENFVGLNMPIPIIIGNPQARSATFSTAQALSENSRLRAFLLTRNKDYAFASIDNETLEASADAGAFMKAATVEIDGAIQAATRSLATALFRDGSGAIGRINATVAGTTLTLATLVDIVNFEVGMRIQFSSAATSASLRVGGPLVVTAIDRSAGSMTVGANLNTITTLTSQDFINVAGDIEAKVRGLDAWIPSTVTSTAFFGVDRTIDSTRLGGQRIDASLSPIEEGLVDGVSLIEREGGTPSHMFMNFANLANLRKSLGTKVQYVQAQVEGKACLSFQGIQIHGNKGPITVLGDQNCPGAVAYALQLDTWALYSLGMAPKILDADGLKMLRENSADSTAVRVGYYGNAGCKAPGWNGRITLAS